MQMFSGSFVGTGSSNAITGVGFQPVFVLIKTNNTSNSPYWKLDQMGGTNSEFVYSNGGLVTNAITALGSDGFTVGVSTGVNDAGVTSYFTCIGSDSDVFTGSYSGDGNNPRSITGIGFQPAFVMIQGTNAFSVFKTSAQSTAVSFFNATADATNLMTSLDSDGFTVTNGTQVNATGRDYVYIAIKANSGLNVGTYTGNGTSQSISGFGFQPAFVTVKRNNATVGYHRYKDNTGDSSAGFASSAFTTDRITSLDSDGFSVGSQANVNANAGVYWYWALKAGTGGGGTNSNMLDFIQ